MNSFYKDFGLTKVDKKIKNNQEVYKLYLKPKKDKKGETPRFYNFEKNNTHMMDILYMPEDNGFKYCLVVVDVGSKLTDAEQIKIINSKEVLNALLKIYKRKLLEEPKKVIVDSGKEFMGQFEKYCIDNDIVIKKALAGRHRQVGLVEKHNGILARVLFMRMASEELLTGEPSKEWVEDLPHVLESMNKRYGIEPPTEEELLERFNPYEQLKQKMIPLGTTVRVQLDEPRNITGEKLIGKFRATDHRWSIEKYKIVNFIFDPIEPIMYILNKKLGKNERVAYTKNQLQIVNENEEDAPYNRVVRRTKKQELYIIKDILEHRKHENKDQYLIWWKGFPKETGSTWEYKNNIPKELIKMFENS